MSSQSIWIPLSFDYENRHLANQRFCHAFEFKVMSQVRQQTSKASLCFPGQLICKQTLFIRFGYDRQIRDFKDWFLICGFVSVIELAVADLLYG